MRHFTKMTLSSLTLSAWQATGSGVGSCKGQIPWQVNNTCAENNTFEEN